MIGCSPCSLPRGGEVLERRIRHTAGLRAHDDRVELRPVHAPPAQSACASPDLRWLKRFVRGRSMGEVAGWQSQMTPASVLRESEAPGGTNRLCHAKKHSEIFGARNLSKGRPHGEAQAAQTARSGTRRRWAGRGGVREVVLRGRFCSVQGAVALGGDRQRATLAASGWRPRGGRR